jgi:hypothetical protein
MAMARPMVTISLSQSPALFTFTGVLQAVAADNAGNYHSARSMYLEGIQMLINAADITRDEAQCVRCVGVAVLLSFPRRGHATRCWRPLRPRVWLRRRRTLREHVDVYLKRLETLKKLMDAQPVQVCAALYSV